MKTSPQIPKLMDYEATKNKIAKYNDITSERLEEILYIAKQYWNPRNYDKGEPIMKKYGWVRLFDAELRRYGYGKRFFFYFKDYTYDQMSDADTVMTLFKNSPNFRKYAALWKAEAPSEINSTALMLVMLTEITVKGQKREASELEKLRKAGKTVIPSTGREDYLKGIDAWVDGKPVQIKSEATQRGY